MQILTGPHWMYFCVHLIVTLACLRVCGKKSEDREILVIFVTEKVTASDSMVGDYFGHSVSTYGGYAIIGALYNDDDDNGEDSGSAYIFERNESNDTNDTNGTNGANETHEPWIETQKLIASDGIEDARFGAEKNGVAISGNYAIVGAYADDAGFRSSGSAYIFERNIDNGSWIEVQKLVANDAGIDRRFGTCVDIDGDFAIVGSTGNAPGGSFSASAYIFERRSSSDGLWIQTAKLSVDDAAAEERFAATLSLSGSIAVVGAQWDDVDGKNGTQFGSAYIFERSNISGTWNLTSKIVASDGAPGDVFGRSVSIYGDLIIVGAYLDDGHGSAYIFERDVNGSWSEMDKLVAHDAAQNDQFGHDVSINQHYAIVGAVGASVNGTTSGSVYIFKRDVLVGSWNQVVKLVPSNVTENGKFGHSVWISEENITVIGESGQEAAYFYQISLTDSPTNEPTMLPSNLPSLMPSTHPSTHPSLNPSLYPSLNPSVNPSETPSWLQSTDSENRETSVSPTLSGLNGGSKENNEKTVTILVIAVCVISCIACIACAGCFYYKSKNNAHSETEMTPIHPHSSKVISEWKADDVGQWLQKILYKNLSSEASSIDLFMKEFEKHCITGGILLSLATRDAEFEQLRQEFSKENQVYGIWATFKNALRELIPHTDAIVQHSNQSASSVLVDVKYANVADTSAQTGTAENGQEKDDDEGLEGLYDNEEIQTQLTRTSSGPDPEGSAQTTH